MTPDYTPEVADALNEGPLCVKCIATRLRLTRVAVHQAVAELRRTLIETTEACLGCGGRGVAVSIKATAA